MPKVSIHGFDNSVIHLNYPGAPPDNRTPIQRVHFIEAEAQTLGEALAAYCREADVTIVPYDGRFDGEVDKPHGTDKYFLYDDGGRRFGKLVTDIHIRRGKENICPKQDLSFPLEEGDHVHFGFYGC